MGLFISIPFGLERSVNQSIRPSFASGRSIFLYGQPGVGKTSIAEALGSSLPGEVYIPQALEVGGRSYDSLIQ